MIMDLYLLIFTSEEFHAEQVYESHKELFVSLEKHFTLHLVPYTEDEQIPQGAYKMPFIADGHVADIVIRNFSVFPYPITLLADGVNNSLAAALEVATWVRTKDMRARIIYGKVSDMVKQVLFHHQAYAAKHKLKGKRIGLIGAPAPWLVASHADYLLTSRRWGVTYVDIPVEEIYKHYYAITDEEVGVEASLLATNAQACQDVTPEELLCEMRLYYATRKVCEEYHLDAVTLSRFSMLQDLKITGCVAVSLLNDNGIPAGSEGDLQAIMTLLMVKVLTGQQGFIANPSLVDTEKNTVLLAHDTIGTQMVEQYILRSHFDTPKGIAIQGIMHEGNVTVFKCGGECLDEYYVASGYLTENTNFVSICRTQLLIKLNGKPADYFLKNPLGNHHILIKGDYCDMIQEFMQQNRCRLRE